MRFFIGFFTAAVALFSVLWATDAPGSGMGYAVGFFGLLLVGTLLFNKFRRGGWLSNLSRAGYLNQLAQLKATASATSTEPSATTEADLTGRTPQGEAMAQQFENRHQNRPGLL